MARKSIAGSGSPRPATGGFGAVTVEVAGSKVYTLVEFNDELYPNLASTGDPEMLAISALLVMPRSYADAHPQAVSAMSVLLLTAAKDIEGEAYGTSKPFDE